MIVATCFTANAANNPDQNIVKATGRYCDADLNQHRQTSLFPDVKTAAMLDSITCHSDTGYINDYDFGGKDEAKGDSK